MSTPDPKGRRSENPANPAGGTDPSQPAKRGMLAKLAGRAGQDEEGGLAPWYARLPLGLLLIAVGVAAIYALIAVWPAVDAATRPKAVPKEITVFWWKGTPSSEVSLLLMVTFASALGSSLHASISFSDYVGNQRLHTSWLWWYVLRSFVGVALAVLFYFAVRGGFFSNNTTTSVINPFGIAAIAGLVGLFSKQATDKLQEIFDTMFRTAPGKGDDQRGDSIVNPRPVLAGVEPVALEQGAETTTVRVTGEGFIPRSVVEVSASPKDGGPVLGHASRYVDPGTLDVTLLKDDLAQARTLYLVVVNPTPGGGRSGPGEIEIVEKPPDETHGAPTP